MSYSRWVTSHWYTYWLDGGATSKKEQLLSINYSVDEYCTISYKECKKLLIDPFSLSFYFPNASIAELKELLVYISNFIQDVDNDFKLHTDVTDYLSCLKLLVTQLVDSIKSTINQIKYLWS